jgi:signal transduction histidine kinase/CheY-like chemotaxis protein
MSGRRVSLVAEPVLESFEAQLVQLLSSQPRRMFLPLFLAIVVIAGLAARSNPLHWVVAWFALASGIMFLRLFCQSPKRFTRMTPVQRLRFTVALVALSASSHGLSLLLFVSMAQFEQAVLSMMLVGLTAGSVATSAGYRPIFLAYVTPTLGPVLALWIFSPGLRDLGWIRWLMAVLFLLFALVLDALARDMFRVLRESFEIRQERAALNRDLQLALEAAENANRAKTRFLASASHDLRQPMQTLSLFAAALEMRPLDERSRDIARNINEALRDLTTELDALLDVSKLDAGTVQPEFGSFALRPLLQRVADLFAPMASGKQLTLHLDCPENLWVSSDRKLLERVARNLVENAVKYTDTGSVRIEAVTRDGRCELAICDTGCGIDAEEHERVFEEFYQVSNPGRDRKLGLGLGLAIVKRLAGLLELGITLHSAPGRGTRFGLSLPLGAPTAEPMPHRGAVAAETRSRLRVLLVDDEEGIRNGMSALLEEAGSQVDCACDSAEAHARFAANPPDLLIVDFRLGPTDNGIDTIKQLRAMRPLLPAFLMTGETAPDRLRAAHDADISILHKPVPPHVLLQELTKIAMRTVGESANDGQRRQRGGVQGG